MGEGQFSMVLNVEPHTSVNYALVSTPNANEDHQANYGTIQAWRYRYNDAGDLVGMSDARGCGANYYYDGAGRLLGEDYFGCSEEHAQYSPPPLTDAAHAIGNSPDRLPAIAGTGLEVLYAYDTYNNPQTGSLDAGADECNPATANASWSLGRLTRVQDLASENLTLFDGRGRTTCAARRILAPWEPSSTAPVPAFTGRYTPRWYAQNYAYDAADRSIAETTGVQTLQDPTTGSSTVFTHYGPRGTIESVTSSYGDGKLINRIDRTADNLVTLIEYGDIAATTTTTTFDDRRRIHTLLTVRAMQGWPESPEPSTQQSVLQDEQFFYDIVGNPIEVRDHRIPEEWPAGAKPVHRKLQYDDLYRVKRIDYEYSTGDDTWESPFKAELDPTFPEDTRRAQPSPHVAFAKRVLWQSYQYDWLGNNAKTDDDAHGFYDRSLGDIDNDTAAPYQLTGANNTTAGASADGLNRTGQLAATYDEAGHLETLFVQRGAAQNSAACLGGTTCSQAFRYTWDELGRLQRARRWDVEASTSPTVPTDDESAAAHLRYHYGAGDNRVLKTAVDPQNLERHAVYIFPSLELRGTDFDAAAPGDFTRDASTEVGYLFANGVRLARLVNEPLASSPDSEVGGLHVFFELGDHLGSHSLALDKATSELVERSTYQAYGGAESSYRPEKWGAFREDYRFTGKEEDVEVGLVYFGKRYLNTALQRWVSPDPLQIHSGGADPNLYAYVSGRALKNVDPIGLDPNDGAGGNTGTLGGAEGTSGDVPYGGSQPVEPEPFRMDQEADYFEAPEGCGPTIGDCRSGYERGRRYGESWSDLDNKILEHGPQTAGEAAVQAGKNAATGVGAIAMGAACAANPPACAAIAGGMIAGSQSAGEAAGWTLVAAGSRVGVKAKAPAGKTSAAPEVAENAAETAGKGVPFGFRNAGAFGEFGNTLKSGLSKAGFGDAKALFQGSSVTGKSFRTGKAFDAGRVSDFDIALADPGLLARAKSLGIGLRSAGTRTGPLSAAQVQQLGLGDVQAQLSQMAGRPVNFMIFGDAAGAAAKAPSILVP